VKIGLSLSPELLSGTPEKPGEKKLLQYFGTPFKMIESVKSRGINSVELRYVSRVQDPERFIDVYNMIWEAGLEISIHGRIEGDYTGDRFEQVYPPMSYILE